LELLPPTVQVDTPIVLNHNDETTVAKVSVNSAVGDSEVRIDPITASNLGFRTDGEKKEVQIEGAEVQSTQQVKLQNLNKIKDKTVTRNPDLTQHLRKQIFSQYLSKGDTFVVPEEVAGEQVGVEVIDFTPNIGESSVAYISEDTEVKVSLVNPESKIEMPEKDQQSDDSKLPKKLQQPQSQQENEHRETTNVSFADIGGLHQEIKQIREMVERPLCDPSAFQGVPTPSGVLLYGPPGTGKTRLAKAVSNEVDAAFYAISGAEIFEKNYGESEENLRSLFDQAAENKPAVIFIDELEALIPSRENLSGVNQVEKRVVTQLKTLMDGFSSEDELLVLGATNHPDELDKAFLRPGRFDRKVEIGVPDSQERKEILQIHTRDMQLQLDDEKINEIVDKTTGYTGADLSDLCRESNMAMQRRLIDKYPYYEGQQRVSNILQNESEGYKINDFRQALDKTEPSLLQKFNVDVPETKWSDIGGNTKTKMRLQQHIDGPLKAPSLWSEKEKSKGLLLYGPPGTGKTMLAKAMATESERVFVGVQATELKSKWVGETEKNIRQIFTLAENLEPSILYIDEMEAIAQPRGNNSDSGVSGSATSQLLSEMDGIEDRGDVIVVGSTNAKYSPEVPLHQQQVQFGIDPAILRPGRLESHYHIDKPDNEERKEIFQIHLSNVEGECVSLSENIDVSALAQKSDGVSGADIEGICWESKYIARSRVLNNVGGFDNVTDETILIKQEDLDEAIEQYAASQGPTEARAFD
jgi:transitional endoplasmic reticulum ATPase